MAIKLPRRAFIRGLGGSLLALPALDAMFDERGVAHSQTGPARFLVTFAGTSIGGDSRQEDVLTPSSSGRGYELLDGTRPLADPRFGAAQDHITIVSNLSIPIVGSPDPSRAERQGDFHSHHVTTLMAGTGADGRAHGTTADHLVHEANADGTELLIARTHVDGRKANGDGSTWFPGYVKGQASWRDGVAPMAETEPSAVFDRYFPGGGGMSSDPELDRLADFRRRQGMSVLDLVHRRAERLSARLGSVDRSRITDHMDAVRTLERQLSDIPSTSPSPMASCGSVSLDSHTPGMHPEVANYYYERERAVAWSSLWHLLFTCDLVRTGSHMHTFAQCFLPGNILTGQNTDLHETTHGGADGDHSKAVAWHVEEFGRLVGLLRDTPEGATTVLDNCAMVMVFEGGSTAGPGFGGGSHTTENMSALIAGGAGGLLQGEHLIAPDGFQPGNVIVTAMRAVGVDASLGALSREIPGLRS